MRESNTTTKRPIANRWLTIGGTLLVGLFVAYLDRSNLSIALTDMSSELGFSGDAFVKSSVLTAFTVGYAISNIFGGVLTKKMEPKTVVLVTMGTWSAGTFLTGFITLIPALYVLRILLGVCEGFYWPQQSRFVMSWFSPDERSRANSIVQYYGQFLALAIGFAILTPLNDAFGWRVLFFITGALGLVVVLPLYVRNLRKEADAPYIVTRAQTNERLTLKALGGPSFFLVLFTYFTQGMLFWGITLWLSTVVSSLGFSGYAAGFMTGLPYLAAVLLAIPMTAISDKTGRRVQIASAGLIIPGILLMLIGAAQGNNIIVMVLITVAMGYYAASFTPNIWTIVQSNVAPSAVGTASGIINGTGAGLGGTLAGYLVGMLYNATGSYMPGFITLGVLVILGGISLIAYQRMNADKGMAQQVA